MSEPTEMELVVGVDGGVRCVYDESLDLRALGRLTITRASHVEPDSDSCWEPICGQLSGLCWGPSGCGGCFLRRTGVDHRATVP